MAATSGLQRDRVAAVSEKIPRANTALKPQRRQLVFMIKIYIYICCRRSLKVHNKKFVALTEH